MEIIVSLLGIAMYFVGMVVLVSLLPLAMLGRRRPPGPRMDRSPSFLECFSECRPH